MGNAVPWRTWNQQGRRHSPGPGGGSERPWRSRWTVPPARESAVLPSPLRLSTLGSMGHAVGGNPVSACGQPMGLVHISDTGGARDDLLRPWVVGASLARSVDDRVREIRDLPLFTSTAVTVFATRGTPSRHRGGWKGQPETGKNRTTSAGTAVGCPLGPLERGRHGWRHGRCWGVSPFGPIGTACKAEGACQSPGLSSAGGRAARKRLEGDRGKGV